MRHIKESTQNNGTFMGIPTVESRGQSADNQRPGTLTHCTREPPSENTQYVTPLMLEMN